MHYAEDEDAHEEPVRELEQAVVLAAHPVHRRGPHGESAKQGHPAHGSVDACEQKTNVCWQRDHHHRLSIKTLRQATLRCAYLGAELIYKRLGSLGWGAQKSSDIQPSGGRGL